MKLITRVAATTTAMLSITALGMPLATSASAASNNGKIRVCVAGLRGGDADVRVAWQSRQIDSGDCRTFRSLRSGRTYRVVADAARGCRIFNDEKYVTARRDPRTVVFYGRCFDRGGRGDSDGRWGGGRP